MELTQPSETKEIGNCRLLGEFRQRVGDMTSSSAASYGKAVACLGCFLAEQQAQSDIASECFLENWLVYMSMKGLAYKTGLHYLDAISGLYRSVAGDGYAEVSGAFANAKAAARSLGQEGWTPAVSEDDFARLVNTTRLSPRQEGELRIATDILLFSLLNKGMKLLDVAKLKRCDLQDFSEESQSVAERHTDARRRYVFPLGQSDRTARQLEDLVVRMVTRLFDYRGIKRLGGIQDTIRCYWAYAAGRCGASADAVVTALGCRPAGIPVFSLCRHAGSQSEVQSRFLSKTVSDLFVVNPLNWYAMRLRPGVKFDRLKQRVSEAGMPGPEMFYPCDEIARRVGKKLVYEEKPLLPDIVFFKSRVTDIQHLFGNIGDLAWCYRHNGSYASIPKAAMDRFQRAIGKFTPDYEVGPVGSIRLRKGDRVVVVGGPFAGYDGEVVNEPADDSNVVYRIVLWGGSYNIEWRVSDRRLIEKR